tara:strand:+ start:187 stop:402 length:216 start_codon:yes stop_codon:yes gene_type:complete
MTDIQPTVEKALAVGVGSALVSGVGSLIPKHGISYVPEVSHNMLSLSTFGALGSALGAYVWFTFRKQDTSN